MISLSLILLWLIIVLVVFFYIVCKFGYVKCHSNVCLLGKTAVVTGGSQGLGYEIVLNLASRGCRVIVAGRTINEELKRKIINTTHNENIVIEYVDFTSFKSVRALAERIKTNEKQIDILINNAGIPKSLASDRTEDGFKKTMQVNHYSHFLLTHLLVDLLKKSDNGRIIFTCSYFSFLHILSSAMVTPSKITFPPPALEAAEYPNSKFCNLVTSDIFAEKLKKWNITSNCYNPLIAKTEIFQKSKKNMSYVNIIDIIVDIFIVRVATKLYGIEPNDAIQGAIKLAVSDECKNVTGVFLGKFFPNLKPRGARDKMLCENIWKASEIAVNLQESEKLC